MLLSLSLSLFYLGIRLHFFAFISPFVACLSFSLFIYSLILFSLRGTSVRYSNDYILNFLASRSVAAFYSRSCPLPSFLSQPSQAKRELKTDRNMGRENATVENVMGTIGESYRFETERSDGRRSSRGRSSPLFLPSPPFSSLSPFSSPTAGTILWCIQIIPQIVMNYRRKNVVGLSPWLMYVRRKKEAETRARAHQTLLSLSSSRRFIWSFASIFLGAYAIAQSINIPIIVQPQLFGFLSAFCWVQVRCSSLSWSLFRPCPSLPKNFFPLTPNFLPRSSASTTALRISANSRRPSFSSSTSSSSREWKLDSSTLSG